MEVLQDLIGADRDTVPPREPVAPARPYLVASTPQGAGQPEAVLVCPTGEVGEVVRDHYTHGDLSADVLLLMRTGRRT